MPQISFDERIVSGWFPAETRQVVSEFREPSDEAAYNIDMAH
jgi:hypothetical protein